MSGQEEEEEENVEQRLVHDSVLWLLGCGPCCGRRRRLVCCVVSVTYVSSL